MDVSQYKCAIIQYSCESCLIGNNFTIIFNFNKDKDVQARDGICNHMELTFNSSLENRCLNLSIAFLCKNCEHFETRTVIDGNTEDMLVNLNYKCTECKNGDINIGVLFENEVFDLQNGNEENSNQQNQLEKKNSDEKISLFDNNNDNEKNEKNSENNINNNSNNNNINNNNNNNINNNNNGNNGANLLVQNPNYFISFFIISNILFCFIIDIIIIIIIFFY
jgi:hypothetical protein